ncbi:hypothetical protein METHB2_80015 [Candidatus Methylobacter favarea]|uniref:Uncharacterized protein n=1 Tax=Candidatus Methylobacter favarea TaxID=2707345 RepID=A0A8S0XVD7_9GAMM|nr:hypothetical protein METHB2_80015 [Candidatus Methylobacter favarea]
MLRLGAFIRLVRGINLGFKVLQSVAKLNQLTRLFRICITKLLHNRSVKQFITTQREEQ